MYLSKKNIFLDKKDCQFSFINHSKVTRIVGSGIHCDCKPYNFRNLLTSTQFVWWFAEGDNTHTLESDLAAAKSERRREKHDTDSGKSKSHSRHRSGSRLTDSSSEPNKDDDGRESHSRSQRHSKRRDKQRSKDDSEKVLIICGWIWWNLDGSNYIICSTVLLIKDLVTDLAKILSVNFLQNFVSFWGILIMIINNIADVANASKLAGFYCSSLT